MGDVGDLDAYRARKLAERAEGDPMVAAMCMRCGDEYPWSARFDHDCAAVKASMDAHPSTQ